MRAHSVWIGRAGAVSAAALAVALVALPQGRAYAQGKPPAQLGACSTCHGQQGISQVPDAPNLAGQPEGYLRAQLAAYRSGKRSHEVMNVVAKGLSDADIAALSTYFASFQIEVKSSGR